MLRIYRMRKVFFLLLFVSTFSFGQADQRGVEITENFCEFLNNRKIDSTTIDLEINNFIKFQNKKNKNLLILDDNLKQTYTIESFIFMSIQINAFEYCSEEVGYFFNNMYADIINSVEGENVIEKYDNNNEDSVNTINYKNESIEFEELLNKISEEGCNCIQNNIEIVNINKNSVEKCYFDSYKKHELFVKKLLGSNYLNKENAQNISRIVHSLHYNWSTSCGYKLKISHSYPSIDLYEYFNKNVSLNYDLTDYNGNHPKHIGPTQTKKGVLVSTFIDVYDDLNIVVKIEGVNVNFKVFNEFDNYEPYFVQNKLKTNDKILISYFNQKYLDSDKNVFLSKVVVKDIKKNIKLNS